VTADAALARLRVRGELVRSTPQNYTEFRAVATRPTGPANGLGLSPAEAEAKAAGFELAFPLLPDTPDIHPAWKALVAATGVIGKQVHDARLVAVCHVHGITHLLTFNTQDFARLTTFGPGLTVVHPANV
jgi:predicted nucleic acid-binding protein